MQTHLPSAVVDCLRFARGWRSWAIACLVAANCAWHPQLGLAQSNTPPAPSKAAPEYLPALSEKEARIEAELDQPTSLEFVETPLKDVVDYLKSRHQIEIVLDEKALEEAGIGADTPVTRQLHSTSLRSALKLFCRPLELTFYIDNDVLNLTTPDVADSELVTRTYPVLDLLDGGDDYDSLIEAITTTVRPQSWDEVGGPGSICEVATSSSLVISQTHESHEEVLRLLRALRAVKKIGL